jgi:glucose-6-phosphate isomerase
VDEDGLGELLYSREAETGRAGELYNVDDFVQPAVEWGKKAARGLLGGGDFEEADAVAEKTTLEIE